MKRMKKLLSFILVSCVVLPVWADVSPKPEMDFSFIYETENKPLIDPAHSEQIQCKDNQCLESKPLGHYGIQKLYCSAGKCFSVAYEYTDFQKLVISFADGSVRQSNIFIAPRKLRARFNVHVHEKALTVEPTDLIPDASGWTRRDAWVSMLIILILELVAAAAYAVYTKKSFRILYSVAVANLITTAVSWFYLAWYVPESTILWLFCLGAETLMIRYMNLKQLSLGQAFMLGLVINVTSYSLGMMLSFILAPVLF